jgi:hypothetical protein
VIKYLKPGDEVSTPQGDGVVADAIEGGDIVLVRLDGDALPRSFWWEEVVPADEPSEAGW